MDVLSGIVEAANAHVSLEPVKEYRGSFSEFCAGANHNIHFVISGRCALILEDAERTSFELGAGDLVILSDRQNHRLRGDAADGARLRIVSGRLVSQRTGSEAIFECLPPVFTINLNGPTAAEQLDRAVRVGGALEEEAGGRS